TRPLGRLSKSPRVATPSRGRRRRPSRSRTWPTAWSRSSACCRSERRHMFDPKSRYAKLASILVVDGRGRTVEAIPPAPHPRQTLRGIHLRKRNERPDHLAALYVSDA